MRTCRGLYQIERSRIRTRPPLGGSKKAVARFASLPPGLPARRLLAAPWQGLHPRPLEGCALRRRRGGTLLFMPNKRVKAVFRASERFLMRWGEWRQWAGAFVHRPRSETRGQRQSRPTARARWGEAPPPCRPKVGCTRHILCLAGARCCGHKDQKKGRGACFIGNQRLSQP